MADVSKFLWDISQSTIGVIQNEIKISLPQRGCDHNWVNLQWLQLVRLKLTYHYPLKAPNLAIYVYSALQVMQTEFCQWKNLRMKILQMISFEHKTMKITTLENLYVYSILKWYFTETQWQVQTRLLFAQIVTYVNFNLFACCHYNKLKLTYVTVWAKTGLICTCQYFENY